MAGAERDVIAGSVGERVDRPRRAVRPGIGVHAHRAEVRAESRLHEGASRRIERLAGRAQDFSHDRRRGALPLVA